MRGLISRNGLHGRTRIALGIEVDWANVSTIEDSAGRHHPTIMLCYPKRTAGLMVHLTAEMERLGREPQVHFALAPTQGLFDLTILFRLNVTDRTFLEAFVQEQQLALIADDITRRKVEVITTGEAYFAPHHAVEFLREFKEHGHAYLWLMTAMNDEQCIVLRTSTVNTIIGEISPRMFLGNYEN